MKGNPLAQMSTKNGECSEECSKCSEMFRKCSDEVTRNVQRNIQKYSDEGDRKRPNAL